MALRHQLQAYRVLLHNLGAGHGGPQPGRHILEQLKEPVQYAYFLNGQVATYQTSTTELPPTVLGSVVANQPVAHALLSFSDGYGAITRLCSQVPVIRGWHGQLPHSSMYGRPVLISDICQGSRHLHVFRLLSGSASKDSSASRKASPNAGDCDEALGDYQALKERLDKLQKPSTIRSWSQIVIDVAKTVGSATAMVFRFTVSIPRRITDFRKMPREDWEKWKAGAWDTVKHEAHHYWVGTKLLWYDVKISSRLAIKAARGNELSRRERQQLTRTTADLFRLVPMIVILVIPFLEFSLPFLLRIFPNMLPSTYEDKLKKEEELKRRLSIKLELAKFLQDTVAEVAKDISRRKGSGSATELYEFIKKVRSGEPVENSDILRFAQLFNDELTLDNLERVQLVSICQFVGISPFGTDGFLRSRLRAKLQQIKYDDYQIEKEGLENLTEEELRAACRARGMRGPYGEGAVPFMRRQLQDWLDLSLHRGLPSSLLLLSRAFTITANIRDVAQKKDLAYQQVKQTLSVIPEEVVDKVGYETLGITSSIEALQKKLELLKREEALIKEELSRAAVAQANKKLEDSAQLPVPSPAVMPAQPEGATQLKDQVPWPAASAAAGGQMVPAPAVAEPISEEEKAAATAEARKRRLRKVVHALLDLAAGSGVAKERQLFLDLIKKETDRINFDLAKSTGAGGAMVFSNRGMEFGGPLGPAAGDEGKEGPSGDAEQAAPKRLADRVSKMLASIEKELDQVELSIGGKMHILDIDNDGIISTQELQTAVMFLREQLSPEDLQQLFAQLGDAAAQGTSAGIQLSQLLELAARHEGALDQQQSRGPEAGANAADVVKIHMK